MAISMTTSTYVDVEEVGGQEAGCLGTQERPPGGVGVAGCGAEAVTGQDPADGAGATLTGRHTPEADAVAQSE
ncbi:hypothetical protein [Plantactinospora sp. BC1]|uniref:hypothetical protein n=1 Tax=Plantactinospora sp. BC1 TaxID=2108470 RepID=UPI001F184D43|nr:hypothetical protein [Plantactinospora sp. BC1]